MRYWNEEQDSFGSLERKMTVLMDVTPALNVFMPFIHF